MLGPRYAWRFRLILFCLLLGSALLPAAVAARATDREPPAPISPVLERQLAAATVPTSFLIVLKDQLDVDEALETSVVATADRSSRATYLYEALTAHARETQADLRQLLAEEGVPFRAFYIVNMLEVKGDAALAERLRAHADVARLEANPQIAQSRLAVSRSAGGTANRPAWLKPLNLSVENAYQTTSELPWGLLYTGATELWEAGVTGAGIVVASQDTGVEWDHPALQSRYRGWDEQTAAPDHIYNWFDAWADDARPARCAADPQIPCDDHGHGSHTVGTMTGVAAGEEPALGMAPDAEWIGCRNMLYGVGTPASYTACFEFFLAPYPQGGDPMTDGRPDLAPHIINNSWSCPPSEGCDADTLQQIVETVRAAGQFVVASAGNGGALGCESIQDPISIYDATFSAGAHDATGSLAPFSSRGPVTVDGSGRVKPDLAAPGVGVYSAWVNGGYLYNQGTSMASPHVAGAAALLWSAVPNLIGEIDLSEQALIKSAVPVNATVCNAPGAPDAPNNLFGYGRLNIARAVQMAQQAARLELTVRDPAGAPLDQALITVTDDLTGYRFTQEADANGTAVIEPIYAGAYRVDAAGPGGTIPPLPIEFALGESYGPRVLADEAGSTLTYSVTTGIPLTVTLSYFRAEPAADDPIDGGVEFHWQTASESGIAGFNLLVEENGGLTQLNAELIPSPVIDAVVPTDYRFTAATSALRFYLEAVAVNDAVKRYGPFALGDTYGSYVLPPDADAVYLPLVAR